MSSLTGFLIAIALFFSSASAATNMSSLTGFLIADDYNTNANAVITRSVATKQSLFEGRKGYMENILTTEDTEDTENSPPFVIARSRQLKANKIHFQLSIFNFQLIPASAHFQLSTNTAE
jgi:hypothetical protein